MISHISRPAYGTDFFHNFDKFWTDFLQFSAKDGGVSHPPTPPLMCAPAAPVHRTEEIINLSHAERNHFVFQTIKTLQEQFECKFNQMYFKSESSSL